LCRNLLQIYVYKLHIALPPTQAHKKGVVLAVCEGLTSTHFATAESVTRRGVGVGGGGQCHSSPHPLVLSLLPVVV
jgi:hypothetical protein